MQVRIDLSEIFDQQIKLDKHIQSNHNLKYEDILEELKLALAVEMGELANEVRCFKFWSFKLPSEKSVILEEYADGIHFITSLAIATGVKDYQCWEIVIENKQYSKHEITILFNDLFKSTSNLNDPQSITSWYKKYIKLGYALGFEFNDIKRAYERKNLINHQRQDNKY